MSAATAATAQILLKQVRLAAVLLLTAGGALLMLMHVREQLQRAWAGQCAVQQQQQALQAQVRPPQRWRPRLAPPKFLALVLPLSQFAGLLPLLLQL